jgi:hypothetical protein
VTPHPSPTLSVPLPSPSDLKDYQVMADNVLSILGAHPSEFRRKGDLVLARISVGSKRTSPPRRICGKRPDSSRWHTATSATVQRTSSVGTSGAVFAFIYKTSVCGIQTRQMYRYSTRGLVGRYRCGRDDLSSTSKADWFRLPRCDGCAISPLSRTYGCVFLRKPVSRSAIAETGHELRTTGARERADARLSAS